MSFTVALFTDTHFTAARLKLFDNSKSRVVNFEKLFSVKD